MLLKAQNRRKMAHSIAACGRALWSWFLGDCCIPLKVRCILGTVHCYNSVERFPYIKVHRNNIIYPYKTDILFCIKDSSFDFDKQLYTKLI